MTSGNKPLLFAVGGAHLDRRGQSTVPFVPGASNPGIMREEPGGGVFNALRLAMQRGIAAELLSIRGGDRIGETISAAIESAGIIDSSVVFMDRATPSYTAILDEHGDVVAAIADMALYEVALPRQLRRRKVRDAVAAADAIFCDANLPADALERLAGLAEHRPIYALAISPAKAVRLRTILGNLNCLFMNRREALALTGLGQSAELKEICAALRAAGLQVAVISNGAGPTLAYHNDLAYTLEPPGVDGIADVTGAGDALAGGTIAGLMQGVAFHEAVRQGMTASMLTLKTHSASPIFTPEEFDAALSLIPDATLLR
ncbi:Sugar or nucleoside kinase, ribokinase family [Phyllobacterium sp. YR620]|uniref:Carbohydrate kinase n=1 Tax=Phyllobacterium pellucidum TaxID=2740464 RepID=A0A849VPW0_9HYPH|nr:MULTISPECIES: carbohydrate kinase family protein [Phyllobacterium]NTS31506.1 carbohydrate kinase [Phyllobacterium pellucidum]UGY08977.1 carbohydrate kinase family protein [Phyllobacterium sp. T1018]SDP02923.1 Sugar or nucleoside kinase, ribokinase family [Phyllobacterium sp. YR620]SFI97159.1 Sugar or nucleoside kinase, ribokinase family [Phyllobacterium sp. CL33Tsu]